MGNASKELLIQVRADIAKARADVRKFSEEIKRTGVTAKQANQPINKLGLAFTSMGAAAAVYFAVATAIKALRMADEFGKLEQRIKTATKETGDFNAVNRKLYDTALETGSAMADTVSTFQRLSLARKELQVTNDQILTVTKSVQQLGVMSGASGTAMQAGLLQFGQAMSSNVVRAEEFNSIVENLPAVAERIAKGLGVSTGQLRQMVIEGKALSRDVFLALLGQAPEIAAEFKEIPTSLSRATQALETSTGRLLNELEKGTGIVKNLALFIERMATAMDQSDGSFSGFLAASGAFGDDAVAKMAQVAETRRKQAEYDDILKRIEAKRAEIAQLETEIAEKSTRLLGMDPVNTTPEQDALGQALADLRAEREKLNKELKETEALYDQVGKAGTASNTAQAKTAEDYEKKLKDINLQLKGAIALQKQQALAAEESAERIKTIKEAYADIRAGLGGKASQPDIIDISSQSFKSEQLFNKGDYEGAIKAAEKARDMIKELGEAGGESEIVLRGLLNRAEAAELKAAQSIKANNDAALKQANQMVTDFLARAEELKALKVGLDAAGAQAQANSLLQALQAQFAANPLVIPVVISSKGDTQIPTEQKVQEYVVPKPIQRASGGPITGPGSGTSDSILMWGSNGEFMQPEASVKYYGQGFMELIRRRQLPRFADGGLIGAPRLPSMNMPAPTGGAGGTPINLYLDGKQYPVSAAPDVAESMQREFRREALKRGEI